VKFKAINILGCLYLGAASLIYGEVSSNSLAHCGGLFLLDSDSRQLDGFACQASDTTQAGKYSAFASLSRYRIDGLWKDGWTLSFNSTRNIGAAGIRASYKNISYSLEASSLPTLASSITADAADSLMYASIQLERGAPRLVDIRWESENKTDQVNIIEGHWDTEYLRRGFTIGSKFRNGEFQANLNYTSTKPQNTHEEYYVKDSSTIWFWKAGYRHSFETGRLQLGYTGASADIHIFGNTYRENSTKRFMYIPLEANFHYGDIQWEHEVFGLTARGLKIDSRMEKNNKRFFETFAPNRILPGSITQALSFSFLQKNYRIGADVDLSAVTLGGHFNPQFSITPHLQVSPRIELHGYYTYNELEIERKTETTSFMANNLENSTWSWMLESYGCIAGLGFTLEGKAPGTNRRISIFGRVSQIIPFKTDYVERTEPPESTPAVPPEGTTPVKNKNAGLESGGIFRSGFAAHFGASISF